jgi:DNA repair protein RadC
MIPEIQIKYAPAIESSFVLETPKATYEYLLSLYDLDTIHLKEEAYCIYLNRGNKVLGWYKLSSGGVSGTVIDIKLILGIALKCAASLVILSHNHPSGRLVPSLHDRNITVKLKEASQFMDIILLDHMIIHPDGYFSFAEAGII